MRNGYLITVLICASLMCMIGNIFTCFYLPSVYLLWQDVCLDLWPILKLHCLSWWILKILCIFWRKSSLSDKPFEETSSQSVACLLLLAMLFAEQKFLILMKLSFLIIFFIDPALGIVSKQKNNKKNPLHYPRTSRYFDMLSSMSFIVLYFTFRSTAYFGLISVTGIKSVLFARECPVLTAPLVEKTISSPLYCLCSFVKDLLTLFGLISGLYSFPSIYLSSHQ